MTSPLLTAITNTARAVLRVLVDHGPPRAVIATAAADGHRVVSDLVSGVVS